MRFLLVVAMTWLTSTTGLDACEIKWPDPEIEVPPLVQSYIMSECQAYEGFSEETVHDCIKGERYGYRAVVMMLDDPERGDEFAERYRGCAAGLGDLGGRFHRRKAECLSTAYRVVWRFEFMRQASVEQPDIIIETLDRAGMPEGMPQLGSHRADPRAVPPGAPVVVAQN